MNKKSLMIAVVAALVCVGGVAAYQYFMGGGAKSTFNMACAFETCGWTGNYTVKPGDSFPPQCPKCGKGSVFPLAKCGKCGNLQCLNEQLRVNLPELASLPPETACKKCGGPIRHGD